MIFYVDWYCLKLIYADAGADSNADTDSDADAGAVTPSSNIRSYTYVGAYHRPPDGHF